MLDVCLLGTGGTMPLPERALTSLIVRYKGKNLLIDCGEGTQVMIRKSGFSLNKIGAILITHFHADHIAGLPGLLLSIGKSERTEPVKIIGCKGITNIVKSLCIIAPELPFKVEFMEIEEPRASFMLDGLKVEALLLNHGIPCYGYSISLDRQRKFNPKQAIELGIEQRYWGLLQKGESVEIGGKVFTPDLVLGKPRKGLKITYCTDTRPTNGLTELAKNSDLFICEGMYAEESMLENAIAKKHMMFREAAETAAISEVKCMWLTHFSPSIKEPHEYSENVKEFFQNTLIPTDLQKIEMEFD